MNMERAYSRGILHKGNDYRFARTMKQALEGTVKDITIGFIGGSITMGSLASTERTCYAYLVFEWWKKKFSNINFRYINAGIGATTSQFALARVESDLLSYDPDLVFIEFSVNDENIEKFKETFEGLIRKSLSWRTYPGVLMFNNVEYATGENVQELHNEVGKYYDLPIISMKESIYEEVKNGNIRKEDITSDNLHPNDLGHRMVADGLIYMLEGIYQRLVDGVYDKEYTIPEQTLTKNRYFDLVRIQNRDIEPVLEGFEADDCPRDGITDVFKKGWQANQIGDSIVFELECSSISVQYRKSVNQPAPVAKAIVDGKDSEAVLLDANFNETWGDCLYLEDIALHLPYGKHRLEIKIDSADHALQSDFYLVSLITSEE